MNYHQDNKSANNKLNDAFVNPIMASIKSQTWYRNYEVAARWTLPHTLCLQVNYCNRNVIFYICNKRIENRII